MSALYTIEKDVEINGQLCDLEQVTTIYWVYKSPYSEMYFAVDNTHDHKAAFYTETDARKWCRAATKIFRGLPQTNQDINRLNDGLWGLGWTVERHLYDCPVWTHIPWGVRS